MKALAGILLLSSFSAFAVNIEKTVAILQKEKECLNGGERTKVSVKTDRKERKGHHYFGATSYGDIAVLEDSNKVTLYLCKRSEPISTGKILSDISVTVPEFNGCSVPQITKMNVVLNDSSQLYFRWIQAGDPKSSLCEKPESISKNDDKKADAEICEDESKGSIIELTQDVIEADSKMSQKKLNKWYKQKVEKDDQNVIGEYRYTVDYPLECGEIKEKEFLGIIPYTYGKQGPCKGFKMINREVVPLKPGSKKSENKFLAQVFSKKDGEIQRVEHVALPKGYGKTEYYIVHKQLKNGDKVKYKIDPNINAAYNPVEILNETKNKLEGSELMHMGYGMSGGFGYQMW